MRHKTEKYSAFIVLHSKLPNINKRNLKVIRTVLLPGSFTIFFFRQSGGGEEKYAMSSGYSSPLLNSCLQHCLYIICHSWLLCLPSSWVWGDVVGRNWRNSISVWWIWYVDNSVDRRMTLLPLSHELLLIKKDA